MKSHFRKELSAGRRQGAEDIICRHGWRKINQWGPYGMGYLWAQERCRMAQKATAAVIAR